MVFCRADVVVVVVVVGMNQEIDGLVISVKDSFWSLPAPRRNISFPGHTWEGCMGHEKNSKFDEKLVKPHNRVTG